MPAPRYVLEFKWSVSRGHDTYGYNICSLFVDGQKRASCNGGGYDMQGTSLGNFLTGEFQKELQTIADRAHSHYTVLSIPNGKKKPENKYELQQDKKGDLYGMTTYHWQGTPGLVKLVSLDGGCGFASMQTVIEVLGYRLESVTSNKKSTTYILSKKDQANA